MKRKMKHFNALTIWVMVTALIVTSGATLAIAETTDAPVVDTEVSEELLRKSPEQVLESTTQEQITIPDEPVEEIEDPQSSAPMEVVEETVESVEPEETEITTESSEEDDEADMVPRMQQADSVGPMAAITDSDFLVENTYPGGDLSDVAFNDTTRVLTLGGAGKTYRVSMAASKTITTDQIVVTGANSTVQLNSVKIECTSNVPISVNGDISATIDLVGTNELISKGKGNMGCPALEHNAGATSSLTITSREIGEGYAGSLNAEIAEATGGSPDRSAAIGGRDGSPGRVIIEGGTVTATSTYGGAGIGGGAWGTGTVTINSGEVTATSARVGAGIGGGWGGSGIVTINSGEVTATSTGDGAGIGGGLSGSGEITINSGKVTATSTLSGAGIGSGTGGSGTVTINSGEVTATSNSGASIGGGSRGTGTVIINSGEVTATSTRGGAGIGGGTSGSGEVTINSGKVTATNIGSEGAGIGGGMGSSGTVTITGGVVTATGSSYLYEGHTLLGGAGIGGGSGSSGNVTITGGTVTANGDAGSAIGEGSQPRGLGSTTITGGSVKAKDTDGKESFSPAPTDDQSNSVALYVADGTRFVPANGVKVDGADFKISAYHEGDSNFYLYMTKETHEITQLEANPYEVDWMDAENRFLRAFGDFLVDKTTGVQYGGNVLSLNGQNESYKVYMRNEVTTTTTDQIVVTGANSIVQLNDVKIESTSNAPISVNGDISATIDLVGENELISKSEGDMGRPALEHNAGATSSLTITSSEIGEGYAGSLNAETAGTAASYSAAIGGRDGNPGRVIIEGGTVTAKASTGAGIGSGRSGLGEVTISGGTVTATSTNSGAGIGGGFIGSGTVTINSGEVTATAVGGAGIGSGSGIGNYSVSGTVTINSGKVTATSNNDGAGIGGGASGSGTVTINAGEVIATSNGNGAGIGGGNSGSGEVTINSGKVTATNTLRGAGIGGGNSGPGEVTITGGEVTATGGLFRDFGIIYGGAGIGGGHARSGNVTITGGTVTANGEAGSAIGGGTRPTGPGSIKITGGSVKAKQSTDTGELSGTAAMSPAPTKDGTALVEEYVALAKNYNPDNGDKVFVGGNNNFKVPAKHDGDDNLYLYLTYQDAGSKADKHVVKVGDIGPNYIEWKEELPGAELPSRFVPGTTYTLTIPTDSGNAIQLKDTEAVSKDVTLTHHFANVPAYDKTVSVDLTSTGIVEGKLELKEATDNSLKVYSAVEFTSFNAGPLDNEVAKPVKLGVPETVGSSPIRAGSYKGTLNFKAESITATP
ncbi:hypothetical protein JZO70_12570 [Enterococcus sp. 669A]|uniref:Uncharacterized protein n=1 Tax=Candidatus Enterococcus moelleringii TaxID=2815325 RepID=A0ABS3LBJ2_9ENTE|nr:hypothetical protein [Enterococcus sp. 669A]MBO1307002.1 hypothetical protein [Enterococcus sp. 669A]